MGKSSSESLGQWSQSESTGVGKATKHPPGALTASPHFVHHLLYVLTAYRYVLLCLLFGLMSVIAGVSLLFLSLVFRWKTSSVYLLESVPLYMPGLILFCNGASMIAFMNKHTRRFYLLKSVCGLFLLVALLLIIVSVTTSVIHLPRLHSHRECAYTQRLRACTCVQNAQNVGASLSASKHFIMEEIDSCELVHSVIYDSLRGVFAVSLVSLLVSIFSIMTLYQLYIHERQKIYFNQLNTLRQRIHQRNVLQSLEHRDSGSVYLNHFNHLYSSDGAANESAYNQNLSPRFSSQDLLLDQSSTNFGVSKPREQSSLSSRSRIWSSQSSNLVQSNDNRSESVNLGTVKNTETARLRRYMSVIFDRSINVHSYVRDKLNSFRRINSLASDRLNKRSYHNSQLMPPHVTIPRYSMVQGDTSSGNYSNDRILTEQMRKSISVHSTSSSSHKSTSSSVSGVKSQMTQLHRPQLMNPQMESSHSHRRKISYDQNTSTSMNEHFAHQFELSSQQLNLSDKRSQQSVGSGEAAVRIEAHEQQWHSNQQPMSNVPNVHWSHSSMMETFKCMDEDDLATSDHFALQPSQLAFHNEASVLMENKSLHSPTEMERTNGSCKTSPEEMPSITRFTFGSQPDNRPYMTEFEEAFQNYYNSQHRISNQQQQQQYYTLPIKSTNKERNKRKGHNSKQAKNVEPRVVVDAVKPIPKASETNGATVIYGQEQMYYNRVKDDGKSGVNQVETPYMSEDEFPAIEPPVDYQNAVTTDEIVPLDNVSKTRTMESLTNQLLQPYHYWVQQFMEQMNQNERMDMNGPELNQTSIEFDTVANGGFIDDDDDGAGDTSTSQDIADFELELDDEPINFISDDECHKNKQEVKQETQPQASKPIAAIPSTNPTVPTNQFNVVLKQNTDLIMRTVLLNKATDDYRFDGFRKGCFDEGEDETSSNSTQSSLSNGTESTESSNNSITAEYIKPPTPFTNYYVNS